MKWGRPGCIPHVNDIRWMQGGYANLLFTYRYSWNRRRPQVVATAEYTAHTHVPVFE